MHKFILTILFVFGLMVFSKDVIAADFTYQNVLQVRGNKAIISLDHMENKEFAMCDLVLSNCVNYGTTTPDLYPEFAEQFYVLSPDRKLTLVETVVSNVFSLQEISSSTPIFKKSVDPKLKIKKALFSADNKKILFVTLNNEFAVYDIEADRIFKPFAFTTGASFITFSATGRYAAYYLPNTQNRLQRRYAIVDLVGGKEYFWEEKNNFWDLLTEEGKVFAFSPDDKKMLYLGDRDGYQTLYEVNLEKISEVNKKGTRLFTRNYVVNNFLFADKDVIFYIANRKNPLIWGLFEYNLKTNVLKELEKSVAYWPELKKIGDFTFFAKSAGGAPNIFVIENLNRTNKSNWTRGTKMIPLSAEGLKIRDGEIKQYKNNFYILNKPDDFKPTKTYKTIIWLHGGPNRQINPSMHPFKGYGIYDYYILEKLRQEGFVILRVDYRGSYGYNKKFVEGIKNSVGKNDVADVLTAAEFLKKEIKTNNTYLMGNSYGGYLALRTLAEKPLLFSGAISINGVTDWWTLLKDEPDSIFGVHFNGPPNSANKKLYDMASIFTRLKKFENKKMLIIYGEDDSTVPVSQGALIVERLAEKPNFYFHTYEGESHVFSKEENLEDLAGRVLKFIGL